MGRWFGYRGGYEDICKIWMPEESMSSFSYISEATEELRNDIRKMQANKRTPQDYGLRVRSDITSLHITARNKMKKTHKICAFLLTTCNLYVSRLM